MVAPSHRMVLMVYDAPADVHHRTVPQKDVLVSLEFVRYPASVPCVARVAGSDGARANCCV